MVGSKYGSEVFRSTVRHEQVFSFKRDLLVEVLLSGSAENRGTLLAKFRSVFPTSSAKDNVRVISFALPLLLKLGVLERIGKDKLRVRPEILEVLLTSREVKHE